MGHNSELIRLSVAVDGDRVPVRLMVRKKEASRGVKLVQPQVISSLLSALFEAFFGGG